MAGAKDKADNVTVDVDGLSVDVDLAYTRSWAGVRQAARMVSSQLDDTAKFVAMVEYYESAIANMDEVTEAIGSSEADKAFQVFADAVKKATPKN